MDSHFDQVMRAREGADGAPRRYFAYSTTLDREAFERWRHEHGYDFFSLPEGEVAEALEVDLVFDFPSRFWGGRVASLTSRPGHSAFGRVYEIAAKDWPIVQHKEGLVTGMAIEREVTIRVAGRQETAIAFVTHPSRQSTAGAVSRPFVEAMLRGARAAGLPESWLRRIEEAAR